MFDRLQKEAGGLFKLVDIAPEVEGAMEFIRAKKDEVVLSIAHTDTDYETAKEAIEAGVSHVTHLYNAMNPINHRNPGPIIAASDDDTCEAGRSTYSSGSGQKYTENVRTGSCDLYQ